MVRRRPSAATVNLEAVLSDAVGVGAPIPVPRLGGDVVGTGDVQALSDDTAYVVVTYRLEEVVVATRRVALLRPNDRPDRVDCRADSLFVERPYRHHGISKALNERLFNLLSEAGVDTVRMTTEDDGRFAWTNTYDWDFDTRRASTAASVVRIISAVGGWPLRRGAGQGDREVAAAALSALNQRIFRGDRLGWKLSHDGVTATHGFLIEADGRPREFFGCFVAARVSPADLRRLLEAAGGADLARWCFDHAFQWPGAVYLSPRARASQTFRRLMFWWPRNWRGEHT